MFGIVGLFAFGSGTFVALVNEDYPTAVFFGCGLAGSATVTVLNFNESSEVARLQSRANELRAKLEEQLRIAQ